MLFAETTSADLYSAVFAAAITVIGALTLLAVAVVKHLTKKIEATDTTKATEEVKRQVNSVKNTVSAVYETVNGNGLTGSVRRVEEAVTRIIDNQKDHEEKDDIRFGRIEKYIGGP